MIPLLGAGDFLSWSRTRGPQPGDLDNAVSPRAPDPRVFGWRPEGVPVAYPMRYCPCGSAQAESAGRACWQCGAAC